VGGRVPVTLRYAQGDRLASRTGRSHRQ
jgi:hypothetical protein